MGGRDYGYQGKTHRSRQLEVIHHRAAIGAFRDKPANLFNSDEDPRKSQAASVFTGQYF